MYCNTCGGTNLACLVWIEGTEGSFGGVIDHAEQPAGQTTRCLDCSDFCVSLDNPPTKGTTMNIDTNPHAFPMANYFGDNPPAQGFDGLGVCHEMTAHLFAPSSNDPVISSVVRIMTGREADFGPFFLAAHAISQGLEHCRLAVRIECRNGRRQVMSDDLVAFVRDGEWDVVAVEE